MSKHATCLFQLWGLTEQLSCRRDLYATRARKSPFAPSGEGSFLHNIYIYTYMMEYEAFIYPFIYIYTIHIDGSIFIFHLYKII